MYQQKYRNKNKDENINLKKKRISDNDLFENLRIWGGLKNASADIQWSNKQGWGYWSEELFD